MKKRQKSMTRSLICVAAVLAAIFAVMLLPRFAMVACAAADGTSAENAIGIGSWAALKAALVSSDTATVKRDGEGADKPSYYKLTEDCNASESDSEIVVASDRNVVLDLAGHRIDRHLEATNESGQVMSIYGTLTLTDSSGNDSGRITGGKGKNYGGGVSVGGTFNMTGGTISGNEAYRGGGVSVDGTFNMTGGTISGNEAYRGGGVYVSSSGTFNMTGGTSTGNKGRLNGGGVYCQNSSSVFSISGNPVIRGNVNEGSKNEETGLYISYELRGEENVWLPSYTFISVIAKPASAMQVGVTTENTLTDDTSVTFAKGTEGNDGYVLTETDCAHFFADDPGCAVSFNGTDRSAQLKKLSSWKTLQNVFGRASTDPEHPTKFSMEEDAVAEEDDTALVIPAGTYVGLDLYGCKIDRGLYDPSKTAQENDAKKKEGGNVITVEGTLEIKDRDGGGKITGGNTAGDGGGIYVAGSGSLTLSSTSVQGNSAAGDGGGIYVAGSGSLTLYGVSVQGNSAAVKGGGICNHGTYKANHPSLYGNKAGSGGGIYSDDTCSLWNKPVIEGNTCTENGGAVYAAAGTFEITSDTKLWPRLTGNCKNGTWDADKGVYSGGTANNVYLGSGVNITIGGSTKFTKVSTTIGVTLDVPRKFTTGWNALMGSDKPSDCFVSDDPGYTVRLTDGEAELAVRTHEHKFMYSAWESQIYAKCINEDCELDGAEARLWIYEAPDHYIYGDGLSPDVKISDTNNIRGDAKVIYYPADKNGNKTGEGSETPPLDAGWWRAEITLGSGNNTATAYRVYDIWKADPSSYTIPSGLTAIYGQNLADVSLAEFPGWTWDEPSASVGNSGDNSFPATYNKDDTGNYNPVNENITVTVGKADYKGQTAVSGAITEEGEVTVALPALPEGAKYATSGTVTGAVELIAGHSVSGNTLTVKTVKQDRFCQALITIDVSGARNYRDYQVTATITWKEDAGAAITGGDRTAAYGDPGFTLAGTVSDLGTGEGKWSWRSSDPAKAEIGSESGEVTIKKAGAVSLTAVYESDTTYGEAAVKLTVSKAPLSVTARDNTIAYGDAPSGNGVTYSGFVYDDTDSSISGTLILDYDYVQGQEPGEYAIIPSGLFSDSYDITFVKGKLTVTPAFVHATSISIGIPGSASAISTTMKKGDTLPLTAAVLPENATDKSVVWSVTDTSVATVSNGTVTAVGNGKTTVIATTKDGGLTASCEILVISDELPPEVADKIEPDKAYTEDADKPAATSPVIPAPVNVKEDMTIPLTYDSAAVTYDGKKANPEDQLGAKIDLSAIAAGLTIKDPSKTINDLIKVTWVVSGKDKGARYFYPKLTITKDGKSSAVLSSKDRKALKSIVKKANKALKKKNARCKFTVNKRSLTDGDLSVKVQMKNGAIKLKKKKIAKVNYVKLKISDENTITLKNGKDCKITLIDAASGLVKVEAKKNSNFTGSVTLYVE